MGPEKLLYAVNSDAFRDSRLVKKNCEILSPKWDINISPFPQGLENIVEEQAERL